MKEPRGNPYAAEIKKAIMKKKSKTTICARAIEADGEPSKFSDEDAFWRFCRASAGKKTYAGSLEVGIHHSTQDDCLGCPFAGGKHGVPENVGFIQI